MPSVYRILKFAENVFSIPVGGKNFANVVSVIICDITGII